MKAKIILWKNNKLKDGTHPIKVRITSTVDGKTHQKYIPVNVSSSLAQWDNKTSRVNSKHPNAAAVNRKISKIQFDYENQLIENNNIDLRGYKNISFLDYYEDILINIKEKRSAGFYLSHQSIKNKFKAFNPNLKFENFTVRTIRDYETHLLGIGNSSNTIHNNLKRIKYIVQQAVKDGLIEYTKNPFLHHKSEKNETKKTRLAFEKIKEIENLKLEKNSSLWNTRNYWMFSFYCGGIRFADLCRLKASNCADGRLIYTMNKTTKHRNILLTNQAQSILRFYKSKSVKLLFPILTDIPTDKFEELAAISSRNTIANKNLKKLALMIESPIKLSFHSSRHSFADYAKESGLDIHTIKELLGHEKISTTEIYMKSFYKEQTDDAMKAMFKTS